MKEIFKYGFILFLICFVASFLLAEVYSITKPLIQQQAQKELTRSLKQLLPEAVDFKEVILDDLTYYKAYDSNSKFIGIAFVAKKKGYSSVIVSLVAMSPKSEILSVKILSENETPGLGSRIKEKKFLEQFQNKKINELKNIQTITSATISSKAVINSVEEFAKKVIENIEEKK